MGRKEAGAAAVDARRDLDGDETQLGGGGCSHPQSVNIGAPIFFHDPGFGPKRRHACDRPLGCESRPCGALSTIICLSSPPTLPRSPPAARSAEGHRQRPHAAISLHGRPHARPPPDHRPAPSHPSRTLQPTPFVVRSIRSIIILRNPRTRMPYLPHKLSKIRLIRPAPAEIAFLLAPDPRLPQTIRLTRDVTGSSSTPSSPCPRPHPRPSTSPDRTRSPGWGPHGISTAATNSQLNTPLQLTHPQERTW